jgi:hypothetical protein
VHPPSCASALLSHPPRRRGGIRPEDLAALRQPTWCRLLPQHFSLLLDRASSQYPETLLFVNRAAGGANATQDGDAAGAPSSGGISSRSSSSSGGGDAGSRSSSGGRGAVDEFGVPDVVAQALAEAALMVADPAANRTAAAVSDLAAAAADGGGPAAEQPQGPEGLREARRQPQAERQPHR